VLIGLINGKINHNRRLYIFLFYFIFFKIRLNKSKKKNLYPTGNNIIHLLFQAAKITINKHNILFIFIHIII